MGSAETWDAPLCRTVALSCPAVSACLVIDSFLGGGGTGGIRMGEHVTQEEVAALAREMSLKFAWLNIPRGGAKAGISCAHALTDELRYKVLDEFGAAIKDVLQSGRYIPGVDLGIGASDLSRILRAAGIDSAGSAPSKDIDSNYFTALTVFVALDALLRHRGRQVQGTTFLVEGIGKVGSHLLQLIDDAGGIIVGVSTIVGAAIDPEGIDVRRLLTLKGEHGDACTARLETGQFLPPGELFWQAADVLVPGARTDSIRSDDVGRLQVRFIVPIANAVATPDTELELYNAGVAFIPGFVSNSGGIFCWYLSRLEAAGRLHMIRRDFGNKVRRLVAEADRRQMAIAQLARQQADASAKRMNAEANGPPLARLAGMLRKLTPRRIGYVAMRKLLGKRWASKDSVLCRWYFQARYFR